MNFCQKLPLFFAYLSLICIASCSTIKLDKQDVMATLTPEFWEQQQNEIGHPSFTWRDFEDSKLKELTELALTNNPDIYSIVLAIQSADLATKEQEANNGINYNIEARTGINKTRKDDKQTNYALNANTSYEIDFWNKKTDKLAIAELNVLSQKILLKTARISLTSSIAETYFTVRLQDKQLDFQRATLTELEHQKEMLLARKKAGIITSLEINNQDVEIQTVKARIEDLTSQRIVSELTLGNLLGLPPHQFSLAPQANFIFPAQLLTAETPSQVLRHRPDIQLAEAKLQSAYKTFDLTRKSLYPNITLTANSGFASNALSDLLKNNALNWTLGADIIYTLLDTGTRERNIQQAKINAELQLNDYRKVILNALKDVESALASQASGKRQLDIAKLKLKAQQRLTFETQERYKYGSVSAFNVSIQKRILISEQENLLQQQLTNVRSSILLLKALGVDPEAV